MKIFIQPQFRGPDKGEGGIRRIVEAQQLWLLRYGVEIANDIGEADLVSTHAGVARNIPPALPWVVHTHGLYWREYEWTKWAHDINRNVIDAMRRSDHVTAPSEWVAQALRRGMWLRPTVLYHGVDMADWAPSSRPKDYVLWNKNRPDPICDPTPLITLAQQAPDLNFVTTFGQKTANVRVTDRVGFREMKSLVRNAGVYLSPTRETFGIGTLEAMAAGVPVVAWAWGGQREIIRHGETGWLCAPGDQEGLEEGIRWALKNRAQIGEAARADVLERWTWESRMPPYAELYQRVVENKSALLSGPQVSVIVPCYKLAKYLPDAIRSLQAQTLEDWEAIIVNDASPDDTRKVAENLAAQDPRIRVLNNETNLYLAGALNAGIEASRGRYIIPLDADNMLEPWTLAVLAGALDADRGIHIAYGGARFVLEDGLSPDTQVSHDGVSGWPQSFSYRSQITHRNQIPSTCMYRREVWERSGGYRRRCRTAEDAENWTRVTSMGFVADKVTGRTTLIYRQREDSMSRVESDWDWTAWFPWSRDISLVPFGVHEKPPARINNGLSWPVSSYEPVKVSVVIPVGPGHQDLVNDALDSVQAQTMEEWECWVVNDTGGRLEIPHSWAKVIEPEDDPANDRMYHAFDDSGEDAALCAECGETASFHVRLGPARARNLALEQSRAHLFVPLDADDYLQADALKLMYEAYEHFGGVIYSQWFDDKGGGRIEVYDPPDYDANLLVSKGAIHTVTALYPRDAWREVGGFDEEISHWEDWDFQLKLAAHGVCGSKIPRPLFTYRKITGERRESNRKAFDEGKAAILAKWADIWAGRETLMACAGCPGGGGRRYAAPPTAQQNATGGGAMRFDPREGYTVVQFNGQSAGTRTYRGKETQTNYRFGTDAAHRVKYVYTKDLPGLLELSDGGRPLFEELSAQPKLEQQPPEPQLVVDGPPTQVGETPSVDQEYSVKELRGLVDDWPDEQVALYLAHEKGKSADTRKTAVKVLEERLQVPVG